jgi:preprotein translocase subunit SecE
VGEVIKFLSEVKLEFAKVVWPKTNEFVGSTVIVLVLVAIFSVYLATIDYSFTKLMNYIFSAYGVYE